MPLPRSFDYGRRVRARRQAIANMRIEGIFYTQDELVLIEKADREGRSHAEIADALEQLQRSRRERTRR